jgi:hypothetical protein
VSDAQSAELRSFNLHTAGSDFVEGSAVAIASAAGAIAVGGVSESGTSALVSLAITGGTPHDSVDSGNPIKVGGRAASSAGFTAVATGDRVDAAFDTVGRMGVYLAGYASGAVNTRTALGSDGVASTGNVYLDVATWPYVFNGSNWDRERSLGGITTGTETGIPAAATGPGFSRTGSFTAATNGNTTAINARGALAVNVDVSGTFSADYKWQYSVDGTLYYDFPASAVYRHVQDEFNSGLNSTVNRFTLQSLGAVSIRAVVSSYVSGTINFAWAATAGPPGMFPVVGNIANDSVDAGQPVKVGGYASAAAPTSVSADGDRVNAWLSRFGAFNVIMRDTSGAYVSAGGGGQQYVEDAALGAVGSGTGTLQVARASASAPTSVSADADAVGLWASRFGALNTILRDTAGNAVVSGVAADAQATTGIQTNQIMSYNGATWDRTRTTGGLTGGTAVNETGALGVGVGPGWARKVTDTITANADPVSINTEGVSVVLLDISGTWTATLQFEVTYDGTTWVTTGTNEPTPLEVHTIVQTATTTTNTRRAWYNVHGWRGFRVISTAFTSGTATVVLTGQNVSTNRFVTLMSSDGQSTVGGAFMNADAISASASQGLYSLSLGLAYNGTTIDRIRTTESVDAAPNVETGIPAAGIGPGFDRKRNPANLGTAVNSAITTTVSGADSVTFNIGTATTGTIIFEVTADDATWTTAASVIKIGATDLWISGAVTPAANDSYLIRTTGWRQVRVRTATTLGATVAVKTTSSLGPAIIKTMDMAPQPHAIGQSVLNFQSTALGVSTSVQLIALTSGLRIYITNARVSTGGTTAGTVAIYSGAGAFTEGTSPTLFSGEFAPSATSKPGAVMPFGIPWASPNAGEAIRITTTGITATRVQLQYYVAP